MNTPTPAIHVRSRPRPWDTVDYRLDCALVRKYLDEITAIDAVAGPAGAAVHVAELLQFLATLAGNRVLTYDASLRLGVARLMRWVGATGLLTQIPPTAVEHYHHVQAVLGLAPG